MRLKLASLKIRVPKLCTTGDNGKKEKHVLLRELYADCKITL
jgi:hypothetical protein